MVPPQLRGQHVEHLLLGIVVVGEDLFAHHRFLALHVLGRDPRPAHDVGHHVDRVREMLAEHARVVAHVLASGERIEMTAQRLEAARDRAGIAVLGPLEHHVLEEMGDPEILGRLVAGAAAHERADRDRAPLRHALGEHGEA